MSAPARRRWQDEHWLRFKDGRIVGCHCGFIADREVYDYGDETVAHIVDAALASREVEQ